MAKAPSKKMSASRINPETLSQGSIDCCNLNDISRCGLCEDLNATTRNAILNLIRQVERQQRLHFSQTEISILLHMCVEITGRELRDMTLDELKTFLYGTLDITNPFSLDGLCRAAVQFTRSCAIKRTISPIDFVRLLSVLLRGTVTERADLAFQIMDLDSDGLIRRNVEIRRLLHDTFDVAVASQNPEIDPEEPVRDTMNYLCEKLRCTLTQPITADRFRALAQHEPWIVECLLPSIPSEMTNLVFQTLFSAQIRLPSLEPAPSVKQN